MEYWRHYSPIRHGENFPAHDERDIRFGSEVLFAAARVVEAAVKQASKSKGTRGNIRTISPRFFGAMKPSPGKSSKSQLEGLRWKAGLWL